MNTTLLNPLRWQYLKLVEQVPGPRILLYSLVRIVCLGIFLSQFWVFKLQASERHAMGFIPENPETYATTPEASRYRAYFPPETDLTPYFPKPGDQGKQGSCVAWATAYAARSYMEARRQGSNPSSPEHIFSPAFIFNQVKVGSCDDGGSISDALAILKNSGVASLAEFPYIEGSCSRLPDARVLSDASQFRISNWKKVDTERLDDIKGQIYAGNPVIFGMFVSSTFENLQKNHLYDDMNSERTGGHAMVLVGYSEPKQAFKLINSWGNTWGDDGFGWISYRAFTKWAQNAFIMQLNSSPGPLPQALPALTTVSTVVPNPLPSPKPLTPKNNDKTGELISITQDNNPPQEQTELKRQLAQLIHSAKCADLQATLTATNQVKLKGFVGQAQDLTYISNELKKLGVSVLLDTQIRPWPQCEALLTFRKELGKAKGLKLAVANQNAANLSDGENLHIEIDTPEYPSYVYLTYIQTNGEAISLLSPQGQFPKPLPPNTHLKLGGGENGGAKFNISAPFGEEMIIAVAAASPLFEDALPDTLTEREYLTRFRKAFLADGQSQNSRIITAAVTTLTTHAKPLTQ